MAIIVQLFKSFSPIWLIERAKRDRHGTVCEAGTACEAIRSPRAIGADMRGYRIGRCGLGCEARATPVRDAFLETRASARLRMRGETEYRQRLGERVLRRASGFDGCPGDGPGSALDLRLDDRGRGIGGIALA